MNYLFLSKVRRMDTFLSIALGIGLAAACGFRVFVPLLMLSLAGAGGQIALPAGFAWIASPQAITVFATATCLEILGYYIPWLDHILDTIATPSAVVAGTFATAAVVADMPPLLQWSMALIAGGGMAGLVQVSTVAMRAKTSLATASAANPLFSTLELAAAIALALLAIFLPLVCLILIVIFCFGLIKKAARRLAGKAARREE